MLQPRMCRLPGAANALGVEFEWKLAGLIALRAHLRGLPFRLYSNVAAARPCDDLVLQLMDPKRTFFIQLKHSRNTQKALGEQVSSSTFLEIKQIQNKTLLLSAIEILYRI